MNDRDDMRHIIEELEPQVERLKSLYQQYFMGIEKLPPVVLKKTIDRTIWRLRRERFQNPRLRFKFQQIIQRYNTYEQYWQRIMRQIENGTYDRHVLKAAKRFGKHEALTAAGRRAQAALRNLHVEEEPPDVPVYEIDVDAELEADDWDDNPTPPSRRGYYDALEQQLVQQAEQYPAPAAQRPPLYPQQAVASPQAFSVPPHIAQQHWPAGAPAEPAPPAAPPIPKTMPRRPLPPPPTRGLPPPPVAKNAAQPAAQKPAAAHKPSADDARARALYDQYVTARKASGEPVDNITYDKLRKSLSKQTDRLRDKHGKNKQVDFEVVTKDGKTMIRPVVK